MKINFGQFADLGKIQSLKKMGDIDFGTQINIKLCRVFKKIDEELKIFNELRIKLQAKYGKTEGGNFILNEDKNIADLNKEYEELLAGEIEIDLELIPPEKAEGLTANDIINLEGWILKGEPDD